MSQVKTLEDPCADFTPVQRNALIWFLAVLAIGLFVTLRFAMIDRWMFDNNAEFHDTQAQRENRIGSTLIASEREDSRQNGDYVDAVTKLRSVGER